MELLLFDDSWTIDLQEFIELLSTAKVDVGMVFDYKDNTKISIDKTKLVPTNHITVALLLLPLLPLVLLLNHFKFLPFLLLLLVAVSIWIILFVKGFIVSSSPIFRIAAFVFIVILCCVRSFSISSQERRRVLFFRDICGEAPKNDADAPLVDTVRFLFFFGQGIDSVLPMNIDISTKRENTVVWLRKVQAAVGFVVSSQKRKFSAVSKTYSHSDVLSLGSLGIECSEKRAKYDANCNKVLCESEK